MSAHLVDRIAYEGTDFSSSNIDILGYDRESETMYVEFQKGADVYAYSGIKESTYDMLVNADSVGSFYARHIKGTFVSENVGTDVIDLREEDPIKPNSKWLTNPGGDEPLLGGDSNSIDANSIVASSISIPSLSASRYVIRWALAGQPAASESQFDALSEADALSQFQSAFSRLFPDSFYKIVSVTHYYD